MSEATKQDRDNQRFISKYGVDVSREWLNDFHDAGEALAAPKNHNWTANQILVFNDGEALGRYDIRTNTVKRISGSGKIKIFGVEPRGFEQMAALNVMLDPAVQLGFFHGIPGSGKTYLALAAALELVLGKTGKGEYDDIVLLRPVSYVGRSLGLTPGEAHEKYAHFVAPLMEHLEELYPQKIEGLVQQGKIIAQPIEHLRGANFKRSIVVLDEGQNTDVHVMKTIITRLHHTSKLYVCGDTNQVDEKGEMKTKNGLTEGMRVMQDGKDHDVAIIEFFKSERKGVSAKASLRM